MENPRGLWRNPGKDGEPQERMENLRGGWITPGEDRKPQGRTENPREGWITPGEDGEALAGSRRVLAARPGWVLSLGVLSPPQALGCK